MILYHGSDVKVENPKITQTKDALRNLGYKQAEIKKVIPILEANINEDTSTLVRIALKNI